MRKVLNQENCFLSDLSFFSVMMKQYLFKIADLLTAPVTIGVALASVAVVVVVQHREFLMEIAMKKKENKAEKKNLKEEETVEK